MKTMKILFLCLPLVTYSASSAADLGAFVPPDSLFDVFPLATDLYYVYEYKFESHIPALGNSIDSGLVEYMIFDSARATDTTIIWAVSETRSLMHRFWDGNLDTTYWTNERVFLSLRETTVGRHELRIPGFVWAFPIASYPNMSVFRFADSSQLQICRYSNRGFGITWDTLSFSDSLGLFYRGASTYPDTTAEHWYARTTITLLARSPLAVHPFHAGATAFQLSQNYPNPFNPNTTIEFDLPVASLTSLTIHDISGRVVSTLAHETLCAGHHVFAWHANGQASGVYFYRLSARGQSAVRKLLLIK